MPRKFREHLMRELDCTTHKARRKCFPITRRQYSFMVNYSKTKTSWHLWTGHKKWAYVKSLICTNIKYCRKYYIYLLSRLYAILLSIAKKTARKWKLESWMFMLRPEWPAWFGFTNHSINKLDNHEMYCNIPTEK